MSLFTRAWSLVIACHDGLAMAADGKGGRLPAKSERASNVRIGRRLPVVTKIKTLWTVVAVASDRRARIDSVTWASLDVLRR